MLAFVSAHPPGTKEEKPTVDFTDSEIGRVDLRGVPLQVEHAAGRVGEVVSSWKGADGALKCLVRTDPSTFDGLVAGRLLAAGHAPEVSLGTEVDIDRERAEVTRKEVKELSLVRRGARQGTVVHAVAPSAPRGDIRTLGGGSRAPNPMETQTAPATAPAAQETSSSAAAASSATPAAAHGQAPAHAVNAELLQRMEALEAEKKRLEENRELVIQEAQRLIQSERARVEAEATKKLQEELARVQAQAQAEVESMKKKKTEELLSIYNLKKEDFEKIVEEIFRKSNLPLTADVRDSCRSYFDGPSCGLQTFMIAATATHRATIDQLNSTLEELQRVKKEKELSDLRDQLLRKSGAVGAPTEERFVTVTANASAAHVAAPSAPAAARAAAPAAHAARDDIRSKLLGALEGAASSSGMDRLTPDILGKRRRMEPIQY